MSTGLGWSSGAGGHHTGLMQALLGGWFFRSMGCVAWLGTSVRAVLVPAGGLVFMVRAGSEIVLASSFVPGVVSP